MNAASIRLLARTGAAALGFFLVRTAPLPAQTLYVATDGNNAVEKFTPDGVGTVFVSGVTGNLAFDAAGNLYVASSNIIKYTPDGVGTTFATGVHGPLAFDRAGNLYVADSNGGRIEKFTPAGVGSIFASGLEFPEALAFDPAGNLFVTEGNAPRITKFTPAGVGTTFVAGVAPDALTFDNAGTLFGLDANGVGDSVIRKYAADGASTVFASGLDVSRGDHASLVSDAAGNLYAGDGVNTIHRFTPDGASTVFATTPLNYNVRHLAIAPAPHPSFFQGEASLGGGAFYLSFPNNNYFGYYSFLSDSHYIYHFDLGYEYVFDAADGNSGVYLYDFTSSTFFYTSPSFPFPYLYDFKLNTVLYYFPDPNNTGHYNTDGVRYFVRLDNGQIITK